MQIRHVFILLFFISSFSNSLFAISAEERSKVRMVINLMDYISKDYVLAVKNGEVINEFEYAEMQEFAANADDYFQQLVDNQTISADSTLNAGLDSLQALVEAKADPKAVAAQAGVIRKAILAMNLVPLSPAKWPNRKNGAQLFAAQCATCHGEKGFGDGLAGQQLNPKPTNFHDQELVNNISPLQAYNTISLGIDGTAMVAYNHLSPEEIWDLSFFILGLQFEGEEVEEEMGLSLEEVSVSTNNMLQANHPNQDLASVRLSGQVKEAGALELAKKYLSQSQEAFESGDVSRAKDLSLKAYLEGVEPAEPKIKASENNLFQEVESSMLGLRALLKGTPNPKEVEEAYLLANSKVDEAEELIGSSERSMLMTAFIAFTILLREGLEAFFVILAILSILQSMGAGRAAKWVHGGWISAVVIGITGWFFVDALLQFDAQSRELMEGLIALFAVLVLLYLGFWMHGHSNATKWKAFVADKVGGLLSTNNMIGLSAFSFLVVFREAFESVLFLSSLSIDDAEGSGNGVLLGSVSAAVLLFGIAWAMLKWFKKLPIGKVFLYSSMVILALAFVLAGNGIHAIQEGGFIDIRSFPLNIKLSWLGIYPTWETIVTQLFVLGLILFLWNYSNRRAAKA